MKFGYTIVYVQDVSETISFFETAFGINRRFAHESGEYGELDTGETVLAFASFGLAEANLPGGISRINELTAPAGVEIALVTDDVDAAVKAAVEHGAELLAEPAQKPWGQFVAYVKTPDGILLELCTAVGS